MTNSSDGPMLPPSAPPGTQKVVVISHSPFVYLWPVWAMGLIMAAISYWAGPQVAFVPAGTVAQREARVQGYEGPRDVLIAPEGRPLPENPAEFGVKQPRFRMTLSNNLGIIWTLTLCLTILIVHVEIRKLRSVLVILIIVGVIAVLAFFNLWDALVQAFQVFEIHITANGYLSISIILLAMWLFVFFVYDQQMYMILEPGKVRVRTAIGGSEKEYDTRGLVLEIHRDAVFRHWLLGLGSGDLTVHTAGDQPTQFEWPNVFAVRRKVAQIRPMIEKREVVKAQ